MKLRMSNRSMLMLMAVTVSPLALTCSLALMILHLKYELNIIFPVAFLTIFAILLYRQMQSENTSLLLSLTEDELVIYSPFGIKNRSYFIGDVLGLDVLDKKLKVTSLSGVEWIGLAFADQPVFTEIENKLIPKVLKQSESYREDNLSAYCYGIRVLEDVRIILYKKSGAGFRTVEQLISRIDSLGKVREVYVETPRGVLEMRSLITVQTLSPLLDGAS